MLKECLWNKERRTSIIHYALAQGLSLYYLIQSSLHPVVILHLRESEPSCNVCEVPYLQDMGLGCEPTPATKVTIFLGNIRGLVVKINRKMRRQKTTTRIWALVNPSSRLRVPRLGKHHDHFWFSFVHWTVKDSFTKVCSTTRLHYEGPERASVDWGHFSIGITCHQHPHAAGFSEL